MDAEERERLRRIKEIPKEVRNVLTARLEVLTNVVIGAEREMDAIKDFLNGERSTYTDD